MRRVIDHLETLRRFGQRLGPYLMLEILLPGGTLFALMLFLYQRRKHGSARACRARAGGDARMGNLVPQVSFFCNPSTCSRRACCARPSTTRSDP